MLNRRSLFAAGAAVAVVAAPVAVQATPQADAELIALEREYDEALEAHARTSAEAARLSKVYEHERPRPTGALIARESDVRLFPEIRAKAGEALDGVDVSAIEYHLARHSAPVRARANEIIDAYAAWTGELDAASEKVGYAKASDIDDEAYGALCDVERRIVEAPCKSMGWARLKARVAHNSRPEPGEGDWSQIAAFSVVDFVLSGTA